jgi:hypothetical protein
VLSTLIFQVTSTVFGDINALFEEQEVSPMIEHSNNQHPDACAGQTEGFASGNESAKTNTAGSGYSQLMKQRTSTNRERKKVSRSYNFFDTKYTSNEFLQMIC